LIPPPFGELPIAKPSPREPASCLDQIVIREAIAVLCDFAGGTIPDPRHCLDALPGQGFDRHQGNACGHEMETFNG
jgi:hypothetical protein